MLMTPNVETDRFVDTSIIDTMLEMVSNYD